MLILPASTHSLLHLIHSLCSDTRILISKHQAVFVFGLARTPWCLARDAGCQILIKCEAGDGDGALSFGQIFHDIQLYI